MSMQASTLQGNTKLDIYPDQFFSLAEYHLPSNIKDLFTWCEYFFTKDPIIGAAITKLAAYPVTNFIYSVKNDDELQKASWKNLLERKLDLKSLLIRMGLNYFTFGNAYLSLRFGNTRNLMCNSCGKLTDITSNSNNDSCWEFLISGNKPRFNLECKHCGTNGEAQVIDKLDSDLNEISFVEWNPFDIDVVHYPVIGKSRYFYKIPQKTIKNIRYNTDKYEIKTMPMEYLKAIAAEKDIELDSSNFFHFKRCSLASGDQGLGKPLIIHSLQRMFYLGTLRRAQEAIAIQHLIPFDIMFPVAQGSLDPWANTDLKSWMGKAQEEIRQWHSDPNYIGIMPLPMGTARMGGDGRAMLLGAEIDAGNKEVTAGMGIPLEFIFGGLTWAGSTVSLRLLENGLINHRQDLHRLTEFIVRMLRITLNKKHCLVSMTDLRMADDIQRMQIAMQLNSAQKLSDDELLSEMGWNAKTQKDKIDKELTIQDKFASKQMLNQANAQGEAGIIHAQYSARAEIAHQKALNQANEELEKSMPLIQQRMKRLDEVLNLIQLTITFLEMTGQMPLPPEEDEELPPAGPNESDEPPPEKEEPSESPPPEEQGSAAPPMAGAADEMAETAMENTSEMSPMAQKAWWENPYFQPVKGMNIKRMLMIWANKIRSMSPSERASTLSYIRSKFGPVYKSLMMYINNTPMSGHAGDAN